MIPEIASKFKLRRIINPLVFKINPNIVTSVGLITAVITSYLFYKQYFLLAGSFIFLSGFLDVLDGQIAKKYGTSKFGDFLDHTFDRLADASIFIGIALGGVVSPLLAFGTLVAVLLVSYLGTQAQAVADERLYSGILGRADRILVLVAVSFLTIIDKSIFVYGIWFILILSIITFVQRFLLSKKALS